MTPNLNPILRQSLQVSKANLSPLSVNSSDHISGGHHENTQRQSTRLDH